MSDYLALTWPPGMPGVAAERMREAILGDGGWRIAHEAFRQLVCVRGDHPPAVTALPDGHGVLIGKVFDTEATLAGAPAAFDLSLLKGLEPRDAGLVLTRCGWGAYVALFTPRREPPAILRDPMGGLEAVTWTRDEVTLVASQIPATGPHAPEGLAIDWARVEALLGDIALSSDEVCLTGVQAVAAGTLRFGPQGEEMLRLWAPAVHARRARHARTATAPAALEACIDGVTKALAQGREAILAEASGGLDSAIVACALLEAGAPVVALSHHYWPEPEGDERQYAQGVADQHGLPLTAVARGDLHYDLEKLLACAGGPRPPFNAQDPDHDQELADRLKALGADALFTGHGGDAVFYQMPDVAVAREALFGPRGARRRRETLSLLARRMRMSVWRLAALALSRAAADPPGLVGPSFLARPQDRRRRHPWQKAVRGVTGAKRVQVQALVNTQALIGDSRRGRVADLVHPLLAQPVVELCLATPTLALAVGALDRPLARRAFAGRLPAAILERRGKGDVTAFFARSVAGSLDVLAPFLMEGRLAARGLIDRERLAPLLDPHVMIWRDLIGEIMRVVFVEAWARTWEDRLAGAGAPDPGQAPGQAAGGAAADPPDAGDVASPAGPAAAAPPPGGAAVGGS
ncbi:asparagine synthase-related protein [Caulobacter sp. UNC358MFTsu5.1]|uniref:asparagine synthase-related protein n=1 Tax=Caulobacter sp. UNC358MFTsu5.1 TaxID=1449049 RepID=UPI0009DD975E|nr:asparagine synthase-related protein [Caulobacter sp. UNC358MFTsu5.1]